MDWTGDYAFLHNKRKGYMDVISFVTLEKVTVEESRWPVAWTNEDALYYQGGMSFWGERGSLEYPLFKLSSLQSGFFLVLKSLGCGLVLEVSEGNDCLLLNREKIAGVTPGYYHFKVDSLYKSNNVYYMQACVFCMHASWLVQFRIGKGGNMSVRLKERASKWGWHNWFSVPMFTAKQFLMYNIV